LIFKEKIKSIFKYFLLPVLLVLFVVSRSLLLAHSFSHQEFKDSKQSSHTQNILEKVIFSHSGEAKDSSKKAAGCSLCALSNLQNQVLVFAAEIFAMIAFYLAFISRDFNRVKLAYISSSYSSRAPPVIS